MTMWIGRIVEGLLEFSNEVVIIGRVSCSYPWGTACLGTSDFPQLSFHHITTVHCDLSYGGPIEDTTYHQLSAQLKAKRPLGTPNIATMPPSKLAITDLLSLPNSSVMIPRLGFGVYQSPRSLCVASCLNALKAGYRHIDTAQFYANEKEVGEAVRQSGLDRKDVFITTKAMSPGSSASNTYEKVNKSVTLIDGGNGYVDLFLIHSPSSGSEGRKMLWQALEKLVEEGRAKSIGVSNFGVGHIEEMKKYAKIWPPHVNQIEVD